MLKNTLILPESDAALAGKLLRDAIDDLHIVTMLVFGKETATEQLVDWADQLCDKTQVAPGMNLRRVVWIRKPDVAPVKTVLDPILGSGARPLVAVLDFHDNLKQRIEPGAPVDPLVLEKAFARGHLS